MHYFSSFSVHISRLGLESKTHPPEKLVYIQIHVVKLQFVVQRAPTHLHLKKKSGTAHVHAAGEQDIHCNPYHCVPNRPVERVNRYTRETPLSRKPNNKKNIHSTSKRNNIGPALAIVKVRSFLLR